LVKHVLAAMPIFQMPAIVQAQPLWLTKAMDKIGRGCFLFWSKDEVASGGKCLVKWRSVCRAAIYGGLGIRGLPATGH
jgi:hypothetical protein